MTFYCDSSFFFRQLIFGDLRADAMHHAGELAQRFKFVPLTAFTRFEVVQGLRFEAWRNRNDRTKGLPAIQVDAALNLFYGHIGPSYRIVPVDWNLAMQRAELISRSTSENGWRSFDVIHVASAIILGAKTFYSYDRVQNELARREGLEIPLHASAT